jgi:hypothetical protein
MEMERVMKSRFFSFIYSLNRSVVIRKCRERYDSNYYGPSKRG